MIATVVAAGRVAHLKISFKFLDNGFDLKCKFSHIKSSCDLSASKRQANKQGSLRLGGSSGLVGEDS